MEYGKWKNIGGGEIVRQIYIDGVAVGEQFGENGTNPEFPASEGEIRVHTQNPEPRFLCCPHCGEKLVQRDEQYEDEWPNSAEDWYARVQEEHEERDCEASFMPLQYATKLFIHVRNGGRVIVEGMGTTWDCSRCDSPESLRRNIAGFNYSII